MTYHVTTAQAAAIIVLAVWELIWKGLALWRAAHRKQPYWFMALLIINSAGVLPIIYILTTEQRQDMSSEPYIKTPDNHKETI